MSLPRMSLHIGDYKKDTGHLRAAGHGAYLLLIMHYWATGGLPDDDRQLAAIAGMTDGEWKKWRPIIRPFFGENWKHKRIDEELANAQASYERRVKAGRAGGRAKAEQSCSNATAKPKQPITLTDNPKAHTESPSSPAARARRRVVEAFEKANSPNIPDTSRVDLWLAQGWSPEIFIPVIEESVRKKPAISSLAYFERAIEEAHAKRNPGAMDDRSRFWRMLEEEQKRGHWPFSTAKNEIPQELRDEFKRSKQN